MLRFGQFITELKMLPDGARSQYDDSAEHLKKGFKKVGEHPDGTHEIWSLEGEKDEDGNRDEHLHYRNKETGKVDLKLKTRKRGNMRLMSYAQGSGKTKRGFVARAYAHRVLQHGEEPISDWGHTKGGKRIWGELANHPGIKIEKIDTKTGKRSPHTGDDSYDDKESTRLIASRT